MENKKIKTCISAVFEKAHKTFQPCRTGRISKITSLSQRCFFDDVPCLNTFYRAQLSQQEGEKNPVGPCSSAASRLACMESCVTITQWQMGGFPSIPVVLTPALSISTGSQACQPNHWHHAGVGLPAGHTFHSMVTREALLALVAWQDVTESGALQWCRGTALQSAAPGRFLIWVCICVLVCWTWLEGEVRKGKCLHLTLGLIEEVFKWLDGKSQIKIAFNLGENLVQDHSHF